MAIEDIGRLTAFNDTQTNIEAATGTLGEMRFARRTTDDALGMYIGGVWYWIISGTDAPSALNVYNETIAADGLSTVYYLLNIASPSTIRVYIDGVRQPATDDAAPTDIVTFDVAPDLGAVLLFDYEMDIT